MNRNKAVLYVLFGLFMIGLLVIFFPQSSDSAKLSNPFLPVNANAYPPAVDIQNTSLPARTVQSTGVVASNDSDFSAIQNTLRTFAEIKDQAIYTLDDSRLSQVLANDPRGGVVNEHFLGVVRYIQGKPALKIEEIGLLDQYQARYAYYRNAKRIYDDAVSSGRVTIPPSPYADSSANPISIDIQGTDQDPRNQPALPDPEIVPEIRELEKETGFMAALPSPRTVKIPPTGFKLLSVTVDGDLAHAKVDWDYGLEEDILVKKDGNWYLIGAKVIEYHGG